MSIECTCATTTTVAQRPRRRSAASVAPCTPWPSLWRLWWSPAGSAPRPHTLRTPRLRIVFKHTSHNYQPRVSESFQCLRAGYSRTLNFLFPLLYSLLLYATTTRVPYPQS